MSKNKTNNINLHIIILTYNCLNIIKQCIDSLYKNTNHNFKLFMVENGSKDRTVEYIKSIAKEKNNLFFNIQEKNLGVIKGRNFAYDFSQKINNENNYVIFLDADQIVQPKWVNSYLEMMKNFDVVGVEAWRMNNEFYPIKKIKNPKDNFSYIGGCGIMTKNKIFEKLGKFDEDYDFIYFEDPSFCFKASEAGYKIGWIYNPIIEHQKHNLSLMGERKKYFMKNWKLFQNKWNGHKIPVFKMK